MSSRARLIELIKEKSLKFGDFTLTSGKKATYYLDGKQLTLDSEGSLLVANAILEIAETEKIDCVGGMTLGADPMVGSVLTAAGFKGVSLQGFIVRKEAKQHGTEKWIEGILQQVDVVKNAIQSYKHLSSVKELADTLGWTVNEHILAQKGTDLVISSPDSIKSMLDNIKGVKQTREEKILAVMKYNKEKALAS